MVKKRQSREILQLHRLAGQLHGVEQMLEDGRPMTDVIQQIEAVRGNLKSLEKRLLTTKIKKLNDRELERCFSYLCKMG